MRGRRTRRASARCRPCGRGPSTTASCGLPGIDGWKGETIDRHRGKRTVRSLWDGLVAACEPRVGYARLVANLCYEDCETALDGGESPASPYLEQLRQALELARAHQERRIEKGAVIIERPDITINLEGLAKTSPFRWMKIRSRPRPTCSFPTDGPGPTQRWQHGPRSTASPCSTGRRTSPSPRSSPASGRRPLKSPEWSKRWPPPCWKPIHARTPALGKRCMRRPRLRCAAIPI